MKLDLGPRVYVVLSFDVQRCCIEVWYHEVEAAIWGPGHGASHPIEDGWNDAVFAYNEGMT